VKPPVKTAKQKSKNTKNRQVSSKSDKDQIMTLEVEKCEECSSSMHTVNNEIDKKSTVGKKNIRTSLASNLMDNLQRSDKKSMLLSFEHLLNLTIEQSARKRTLSLSSSRSKQLPNAKKVKSAIVPM
jgi:hypothetical protein